MYYIWDNESKCERNDLSLSPLGPNKLEILYLYFALVEVLIFSLDFSVLRSSSFIPTCVHIWYI